MKHPGFDPGKFILNKGHFEHQSLLHGIHHTYRVMCHCLYLGHTIKAMREMRLAFCAAFIHDMARKHDGYCTKHGEWAAEHKLPVFTEFFLSQGVNHYEIEEIRSAVKYHSERFDPPQGDPFWKTTALLKDADALDRIRLGTTNLNPAFLRFRETGLLIPFAAELYARSVTIREIDFPQILLIANEIKVLY